MVCNFCKNKVPDKNAVNCPFCGSVLTAAAPEGRGTFKPASSSSSKKILIGVAAVAAVAGIGFGIKSTGFSFSSSSSLSPEASLERYKQYVSEDRLDDAVVIYNENIKKDENARNAAVEWLGDYIESIGEKASGGSLTQEQAVRKLETINCLNVKEVADQLGNCYVSVTSSSESTGLFEEAAALFNKGSYEEAIKALKVISSEYGGNSEVEDLISDSEYFFVQEISEKAGKLINEGKLDDALAEVKKAAEITPDNSDMAELLSTVQNEFNAKNMEPFIAQMKEKVNSDNIGELSETFTEIINIYQGNESNASLTEIKNSCADKLKSGIKTMTDASQFSEANILLAKLIYNLPESDRNLFDAELNALSTAVINHSNEMIQNNLDYSGALALTKEIAENNRFNDMVLAQYNAVCAQQQVFENEWTGTVTNNTSLMKSASKAAESAGEIASGSAVTVKEQFGTWYLVSYNNSDCYVLRDYVKRYK